MANFIELNNDQRRETINTRQRDLAWKNAYEREQSYRGSMIWERDKGNEYLFRAYYDHAGKRRQKSLGRRDEAAEALKFNFDRERLAATEALKHFDNVLARQAAINKALGLGRVPQIAAQILRQLEKRGLLGKGLRVVGTNALFCYEAACGLFVDPDITTTDDIDLLFDTRRRLYLIGDSDLPDASLLEVLRRADRSFQQLGASFRAQNRDGFLVDLIKPKRNPPWRKDRSSIGKTQDLQAAEIEGLVWLENAPVFQQLAIDERGYPVQLVAPDPRIFAIHKLWISKQPGRDPAERRRDAAQALAVADLTKQYLLHLPFDMNDLRMIPRDIASTAIQVFKAN